MQLGGGVLILSEKINKLGRGLTKWIRLAKNGS